MLVCDIDGCGEPATVTMKLSVNGSNYETDRCAEHLAEELAIARKPRRGRKRAVVPS
jgi:hypothetical protein